MKIAAAQFGSVRGDVEKTILSHTRVAQKAADHGASYILYPELSLTGYELDLASEMAFAPKDSRLQPLYKIAQECQLTISLGLPLRHSDGLFLANLIILPNNDFLIYKKIHLHGAEKDVFDFGEHHVVTPHNGEKIGHAICADITHPEHIACCAVEKSTIYAASVFLSPKVIDIESEMLSAYSHDYTQLVIMANSAADASTAVTAGQSGAWYQGKCLAQFKGVEKGLVLAEKVNDMWKASLLKLED
ncbi:carbon-nitrogen hydrolase family protein [Temperatibacter marinus]|uniref:Carbon-nitrogen hydrolase family protein n=1 Tax=Temperatibacter marinus TaxID=1456591 RepID=A0AA52EAS4_9PROT|nr:carbon-nitrogen hydrolase family protein [Temperatibacter marinus]WND01411.1 carbon-nitrogen hydrolase family protein [Temperatibacter marinus]